MLTRKYVYSANIIPKVFAKIQEGTAPEKFTAQHLKDIGCKSSNDRAIIPLLKDLGFLTDDGQPTKVYHDYRDPSRAGQVLGQALKNVYGDLFTIQEHPTDANRGEIKGKFISTHNVKDAVADQQTTTFYALLKMADLNGAEIPASAEIEDRPDQMMSDQSQQHLDKKVRNGSQIQH